MAAIRETAIRETVTIGKQAVTAGKQIVSAPAWTSEAA